MMVTLLIKKHDKVGTKNTFTSVYSHGIVQIKNLND